MKEKPIETFEHNNLTAEIYTDDIADDPRGWDNLGVMLCFHKRYNLGDSTNLKSSSFDNWTEIEKYIIEKEKAVVIFPLFLLDHSGITISIRDFSDRWDSGKAGYIYTTKEKIKTFFNVKKVTKENIKKAEEILREEVKRYDQFLTGDVYFYSVIEHKPHCKECGSNRNEIIDSCGGFYGIEAVREEIKEYFNNIDKREKERKMRGQLTISVWT